MFMEDCDPVVWNQFVLQQPRAHPLQLSPYGDVRKRIGWEVKRPVLMNIKQEIQAGFQIMSKKISTGEVMGYIPPAGPYYKKEDDWSELLKLYVESQKGKITFIKWEPGFFWRDEDKPDFSKWGFQESKNPFQPPRTIILDLSPSIDEIESGMDRRTKRYIKKSQENGLHFRFGDQIDAKQIGEFISETFTRKGKTSNGSDYYEAFFSLYDEIGCVKLFLAEFENKIISGRMIFPIGDFVYSIFGASSVEHKEKQPNYGLEWRTLCWAKEKGYKYFDFWGVPDFELDILEANFQEKSDGLWGVYQFKRGFSKMVKRNVGAYDLYI
jgi:peptidoglycan pentaglycine glycine transferase (the first glycine)